MRALMQGEELHHKTGGFITVPTMHYPAHPPPERDVMGASGDVRYERRGTCGRPASHFHTCGARGRRDR